MAAMKKWASRKHQYVSSVAAVEGHLANIRGWGEMFARHPCNVCEAPMDVCETPMVQGMGVSQTKKGRLANMTITRGSWSCGNMVYTCVTTLTIRG